MMSISTCAIALQQRARRWLPALVSVLVLTQSATAQEGSQEPLYDELTQNFKKKSLSVGALFQTVADFQSDRTFAGGNGFSIANMRLSVSGELDAGFGYFFQTNFANSPAILDAKMYYRFLPWLIVDGGLFKAPFSRELLTGAGSIDFVNRSQVVTALAPARQIGAQARGDLSQGSFAYGIGMFNGNSFDGNSNDSDDFLFVARLSYFPDGLRGPSAADQLELALNAGYSKDENARLGGGFVEEFTGERSLLGFDFRLTRDRVLAAGEIIAARLDPDGDARVEPFGWHLTAGYMITGKSQLLFRWDKLNGDGIVPRSDLLIVGYNLWPTRPTELQVNYVIPTRGDLANHQVLVNAQVAF